MNPGTRLYSTFSFDHIALESQNGETKFNTRVGNNILSACRFVFVTVLCLMPRLLLVLTFCGLLLGMARGFFWLVGSLSVLQASLLLIFPARPKLFRTGEDFEVLALRSHAG